MDSRLNRFKRLLRKKGIGQAILLNNSQSISQNISSPDPNFFYFTGYSSWGCLVIDSGSSSRLRNNSKQPVLFVSSLEERPKQAGSAAGIKIVKITSRKQLFAELKKTAKSKNIGVDYNSLALQSYKSLKKNLKKRKFRDISRICSEIRAAKEGSEIALIKKAFAVSDSIMKSLFAGFRDFKTEKEAHDFLAEQTRKQGCELAFEPIVASGKNAVIPHHIPDDKKISKGFCIIDFGVKYKGYNTDTSRTVYLGAPSREEIRIYNLVKEAQESLVSESTAGKKCSSLFFSAKKKLGNHSKYFTHGLGHGVGVQIHEAPSISENSKDILKDDMVFTIEPGIYIGKKGLGIRIEDTIIIRDGRPLPLTSLGKELKIIN